MKRHKRKSSAHLFMELSICMLYKYACMHWYEEATSVSILYMYNAKTTYVLYKSK